MPIPIFSFVSSSFDLHSKEAARLRNEAESLPHGLEPSITPSEGTAGGRSGACRGVDVLSGPAASDIVAAESRASNWRLAFLY